MENQTQTETGRITHRVNGTHILLLVLIFAIIVNLFPFQSLGFKTRMNGYPLIFNMAHSGITSKAGIRHKRGFYLTLKQYAPGVNLLLPAKGFLDISQLYGLGRIRNVEYMNYDPEKLFADVDFSEHIIAGFNGNRRLGPGPFRVALGKETPETIILLRRDNILYLVDVSLLPFK